MQPPPTAADLLATVAELLDDHVVPALSGPVQHQTRVAASLVAIVERELRLGPEIDAHERAAWIELLSTTEEQDTLVEADLATLRARVAEQLRHADTADTAAPATTWNTLMRTVRADLRICKPGHDSWEGD